MLLSAPEIGGLVAAFSVTHIGLSAVREPIIDNLGAAARSLNLVGRDIRLPEIWLADTSGYKVWPDEATAGRQVYRAGYTFVASALLFPALGAYPAVRAAAASASQLPEVSPEHWWLLFATASLAQGISIASLFNPSPLSLVPGFESDTASPLGVRRDDRLKLTALGLTRITRHPLILPVVPWGAANACLAGGNDVDFALFLGLAAYAVFGCLAQDARVSSSAQVGTVLNPKDGALNRFYSETSFLPFGACLDGRQDLAAALREVPPLALPIGLVAGAAVEWATLQWWVGVGPPAWS